MCTGITLIAADLSVIHARTLEFAIDIESDVIVVPRNYARTGTTPGGDRPGLKWKSKYACVGANGLGLPFIFDGVNEQCLCAGLFYFPTSAQYMDYEPGDAHKTLAPWELGSWIMENFKSVEEVQKQIMEVVVPAVVFEAWDFAPEVHFIVQDASGKSIVIEYVGGQPHIHDNPLGVITNSPSFDWHMTNLRNYVNFSMTNHPDVRLMSVMKKLESVTLKPSDKDSGAVILEPFGQGTGMLGMPGDFTPPSRFVRAVAFSQSVLPSRTGEEAVLEAFHILNQFDIPKGVAREQPDAQGNIPADYTVWTSAIDLKAKRFYFRTYENSQIRMVDLTRITQEKLNTGDIVTISMKGEEVIKSLTP